MNGYFFLNFFIHRCKQRTNNDEYIDTQTQTNCFNRRELISKVHRKKFENFCICFVQKLYVKLKIKNKKKNIEQKIHENVLRNIKT